MLLERPVFLFVFGGRAMASCSEREVRAAGQVLCWLQEPAGLRVDIFDAGFEQLRHALLDAWVETNAHDRLRMAPCLDLLTSLKCQSKVPIQTATPLGGHSTLRQSLEAVPSRARLFQDRAVWLSSLAPEWGAAQFSIRFILAAVDYPLQDQGGIAHGGLTQRLSGAVTSAGHDCV